MYTDYYQTPIGTVRIQATAKGINELLFVDRPTADVDSCDLIGRCIDQLDDYFSHRLFQFDLVLDFTGTEFQRSVWDQLHRIPYGATSTYSEIAAILNKPRAMRAVGGACGKNPIAIILPCHRVVARDGALTGYASGLGHKQWLLQHEHNSHKLQHGESG